MENKKIFDSNVWIGFFAARDLHHKKASTYFKDLAADEVVYITTEIISEVTTVLKIRYGNVAVQTFIEFLFNTDSIVRIPNGLYFDITLHHMLKTTDTKLSFTDLTLVVLSDQFVVKTLDKDLAKILSKNNSRDVI